MRASAAARSLPRSVTASTIHTTPKVKSAPATPALITGQLTAAASAASAAWAADRGGVGVLSRAVS